MVSDVKTYTAYIWIDVDTDVVPVIEQRFSASAPISDIYDWYEETAPAGYTCRLEIEENEPEQAAELGMLVTDGEPRYHEMGNRIEFEAVRTVDDAILAAMDYAKKPD